MQYTNELDFARDIKDAPLKNAYLFYGSEEYLKELYLARIQDRATGGMFRDFNIHRLSAENGIPFEALISSVQAIPMMCEKSCTVLDSLSPDKLAAADAKRLCEIIAEIPPECVLVLLIREPDFSPKSAKGKGIVAAVDKIGAVIELSKRGAGDLVKFIRAYLKQQGSAISVELAKELLEHCGSEMLTLRGEMDKLAACSGYGTITREHIDEIATKTVSARVFDLSARILDGDYTRAMRILHDLLYLKEPAVSILSILAMSYTDLYRAKAAQMEAKPEAEFIAMFEYKGREFRARNALRQAPKYSPAFLERSIALLSQADMRLKSSRTDDTIILEQLVTELYRERQRERK